MKASMRVLAVVVSVFALANAAHADIVSIDFDYNGTDGAEILPGYKSTPEVTVDFVVRDGSFGELGRLQWWTGSRFGDLQGGVAMDNTFGDDAGYWGEVSLTVKDPLHWDIRVDKFLLAGFDDWDDDGQGKLGVMIVSFDKDGVAEQEELDFRTLPLDLEHKVVEPDLELQKAKKKVLVQWNYPFNIAIDEIQYTLTPVPEPASLVTWALGLTGLGLFGYRRHRRKLV